MIGYTVQYALLRRVYTGQFSQYRRRRQQRNVIFSVKIDKGMTEKPNKKSWLR